MSNGEVRKVSLQDIQLVQNFIERCLQLYMSQREVVNTLFHQAKIEPSFTELVWQKLEAENQEFFRAYHLRLIVKDQILRFNQLLERQVELVRQMSKTEVVSTPLSNGSQTHSMHNNTAYQDRKPKVLSVKPENMHQTISVIPNVYTNGTSSMQCNVVCNTNGTSSMQCRMQVPINVACLTRRADVPTNMSLARSSNAEIMQEFNGRAIKIEDGYASNSWIMFGAHNNLEPHNVIGEALISPLSGGDSSSHNEAMLEPERNSFGQLGQMTQDFSLSVLTDDFSHDILESYSRLGTNTNFLDSHISGEQQDIRRLDTISDCFSYEGFGSE